MIPWYHPFSQTGGQFDQLPNKKHHSHRPHPSEGAPLLRQAPRQIIERYAPGATSQQNSPLVTQLDCSD
jgi:hypothetical protein